MKKLTLALFCAVCGLGAVNAYASGDVIGAPAQIAFSGFYATGDFGYGRLFTTNSNLNPSTGGSYNRDHYGWSGGVGYNFALDTFNMLGIEADYLDLGQSVYTSGAAAAPANGSLTINSQAAALLATYTTIWNNGINLFLKLGAAYVWQNNDYSGSVLVAGGTRYGSITYQHFEPMGVLGVGYYIMKNLNLFVDTTVVGGDTPQGWTDHTGNITTFESSGKSTALAAQLKVGLSYQF